MSSDFARPRVWLYAQATINAIQGIESDERNCPSLCVINVGAGCEFGYDMPGTSCRKVTGSDEQKNQLDEAWSRGSM